MAYTLFSKTNVFQLALFIPTDNLYPLNTIFLMVIVAKSFWRAICLECKSRPHQEMVRWMDASRGTNQQRTGTVIPCCCGLTGRPTLRLPHVPFHLLSVPGENISFFKSFFPAQLFFLKVGTPGEGYGGPAPPLRGVGWGVGGCMG